MSYCRLRYPPFGGVLVSTSYFGDYCPFQYFKKHEVFIYYETLLPDDKVKNNTAKEKGNRNLFRFLNETDVKWFENVFQECHNGTVSITEEEATAAIVDNHAVEEIN
ncbi:hypothetical protein J6590_099138 [Homalodisca vitripennis]|nr:hypothetical protein J6590_099138 [Homalodisca vitripennis]